MPVVYAWYASMQNKIKISDVQTGLGGLFYLPIKYCHDAYQDDYAM